MLDEKMKQYKAKQMVLAERMGETERELLQELISELEAMAEENKRLKTALLNQMHKHTMSTKLKDALYE